MVQDLKETSTELFSPVMNKQLLFSVIYFLVSLTGNSKAQETAVCAQDNTAFLPGEKVVYKAGYRWGLLNMNAGEVSFTVNTTTYNDTPSLHLVGIGSTYKAYDWFYKVRDRFESFVSIEDLRPYRYIRNTSEGGYKVFNDNDFNYADGKAYVKRKHVKNIDMLDTIPIGDCTYDVLSMIYNARSIDFGRYEPGDVIPISIFLDEEVYDLSIRYLRKEVIRHKQKKYRCVVLSPTLVSGTIFKEGDEMKVWITDDANRIPLVVESPLVVGKVRAVVKSWENLRHPFNSLIVD